MTATTPPVSRTCEHAESFAPMTPCGAPTVAYYPARGGGTMALCAAHAEPFRAPAYGLRPLPEAPADGR